MNVASRYIKLIACIINTEKIIIEEPAVSVPFVRVSVTKLVTQGLKEEPCRAWDPALWNQQTNT